MIKYVPVLKWKTGEREAIKNLSENQIEQICPIIELIDSDNKSEILNQICEAKLKYAFIDNVYLEESNPESYQDLITESKKLNLNLIPVFYIDDLYNSNSIINQYDEVAVRLIIPEPIDSLNYEAFFKKIFKASNKKINLILDLIFVKDGQTATLKSIALRETLSQLTKYYSNINKLIISSTSFPDTLNDLGAGEEEEYKRYELNIFNKIHDIPTYKGLADKLIYSDYGVNKFTDTEIDFSKLQYGVLPKIKYTTNDFYYVQKAKKDRIKNIYTISVFDICNRIVKSDFFYGQAFSYGDKRIYEKGIEKKNPGGNTEWVTISTVHHIAVILKQLSN